MPLDLKEVVISAPNAPIRRTQADVPEYIQRAIADSLDRGKRDAQVSKSTGSEPQDKS
jgi:hypothetical protein